LGRAAAAVEAEPERARARGADHEGATRVERGGAAVPVRVVVEVARNASRRAAVEAQRAEQARGDAVVLVEVETRDLARAHLAVPRDRLRGIGRDEALGLVALEALGAAGAHLVRAGAQVLEAIGAVGRELLQ